MNPYRNDGEMRCDCGGHPGILHVLRAGTAQESRRCPVCCPEIAATEVRVVDPETNTVVTVTERSPLRWDDQRRRVVSAYGMWKDFLNGSAVVTEREVTRSLLWFAEQVARSTGYDIRDEVSKRTHVVKQMEAR